MAQEKDDEILLEIKIDEAATEKRVTELTQKLEELRGTKARLKKEFRDGGVTSDQYAAALSKVNRETKAVSKEIVTQNKALDLNDKVTKSATGSLDQMRAKLAQYKEMVGSISDEVRASKAGQQLIKDTDDLNAAILNGEKSYGVYNRQVGDYSKGLQSAEQVTGAFGVSLGGAKDMLERTKSGLQGMKLGLTGIKGAIAATGIGILILAIGSLVSFLTQSQTGMDFLSRKTRALGAVFNVVFGKIVDLGENLVKAFENPGKAVSDLGDAIKQNLINRLDSFKVILDAIAKTDLKGIANGIIQLFTGVTDASGKVEALTEELAAAAREGERVALAGQQIRDAERELNVERAQSQKNVEKLKKISEDVSKSQKEREDAAREAGKIELDSINKMKDLQERRIQNTKDEIALGQETADDLDRLAEEKIKLADLERDSLGKQTELQNTLNALILEGQKLRAEAAVSQAQRALANAEEERKLIDGTLEDQIIKQKEADAAIFKLRRDLINKQGELEKVGLAEGSEQQLLVKLKTELEVFKLSTDTMLEIQARELEVQADTIKAKLALAKKGSDEELKLRKDLAAKTQEIEENQASDQIKSAEQLAAKKQEIAARGKAEQKQLDDDFNAKFISDTIEIGQQISNTISTVFERQNQIAQNALDDHQKAALKSAGTNAELRETIEGNFAKKQEQLDKESGEKKRKSARIEALINTAVAVTKALTAGPITGPILAAFIGFQGLAQQALISAQKFNVGGYVDGPGTEKSDSIPARLSKGESVLTAKATRENYDELSSMNVKGGGRPFPGAKNYVASAYPHAITHQSVPGFAYGGVQLGSDIATMEAAFTRVISRMPNPVVSVEDINSKRAEVNQVVVRSKL